MSKTQVALATVLRMGVLNSYDMSIKNKFCIFLNLLFLCSCLILLNTQ